MRLPTVVVFLFFALAASTAFACANDCNPMDGKDCASCHVGSCIYIAGAGCLSCDGNHDALCIEGSPFSARMFVGKTADGRSVSAPWIHSRTREGFVILSAEGYLAAKDRTKLPKNHPSAAADASTMISYQNAHPARPEERAAACRLLNFSKVMAEIELNPKFQYVPSELLQ